MGEIHGEKGRFRVSREFACGRMMVEIPVIGESPFAESILGGEEESDEEMAIGIRLGGSVFRLGRLERRQPREPHPEGQDDRH